MRNIFKRALAVLASTAMCGSMLLNFPHDTFNIDWSISASAEETMGNAETSTEGEVTANYDSTIEITDVKVTGDIVSYDADSNTYTITIPAGETSVDVPVVVSGKNLELTTADDTHYVIAFSAEYNWVSNIDCFTKNESDGTWIWEMPVDSNMLNEDYTVGYCNPGSREVTHNVKIVQAYAITNATTDTNGSITVPEYAVAGDTVTVGVSPVNNYGLNELTVIDASDNPVTVENNQFIMPAKAVTVNASFKVCDHKDSTHTTATNNGDGTHRFTCIVCGGNVIEEHTFDETSICTLCGMECIHSSVDQEGCSACEKSAVAHVVNEEGAGSYYCNIVTALSYGDAVASLLTDYTLTEDLTIPSNMIFDTNGHTLTVPKGMTLTNNGGLVFGDTSHYFGGKGTYAENDTAAVKIGTSDGIIFENKLYYLGELCEVWGSEIIGINLETAATNTYYPAGEGYAIYEGSGILRLHNAKITTPNNETSGTGSRYVIYSNGNLNIHFSGKNQLESGNLKDTNAGIYVGGDLTMTAVGENAELTVQCGSSSGNTPGISANSLTVNGGTIIAIGGSSNGSASYGIYVDTDLTVNSGKVNAYGGSGMISLGVGAGTITVADDMELYAKGGEGVLVAADVMAETLSGNVNVLRLVTDESEEAIIYTVYGDLILTEDLIISNPYAEMEGAEAVSVTFTVPAGTSLTVNQGVNLNLSNLAAEDITFNGTVSNKGTILLPASFAIQNAPNSGNVKIGEKSYTWSSGNTNWICNDLSSHFGGEATCTNQAVCEICGESYGELDLNNHVSDVYTYLDNSDGTHTKTHECGYVENASEIHSYVYTADETTDIITHVCICGDVEVGFTLNIPTATYGDSPMSVPHFACSDTTYAGEFPVITIDGEENNFPTNAGTYEVIMTLGEVSVSGEYAIEKAEASVLTAPAGNIPIYNGEAQELIIAGTAKGGTMLYALSEDGDYTTDIPTAASLGSYNVWYYIQGDENHIDSPKVSVAVEIVKAKITAMTPPEDMTLTGYFTNAEDIIAILPTTIEIESEDGTNKLTVTWTFDGEFDTSSLAENNFIWTADVGDLTANGFAVFGEITVTNVEYIEINEKNFPDEIFRNYVNENFDTTDDDVLTAEEIAAVTMIRVSNEGIADLTGVEYFTELSYLDCSSNQLEFLDVSKNAKLSYLGCSYNQLKKLDVSNNANLLQLNCNSNQLTTLDIDSCTEIDTLLCTENLLTALDVSNHKELSYLACSDNQLTSLNVSGCTALSNLYCGINQLTSLDVSMNTALTAWNCDENIFTIEFIEGKFDLSAMPEGFDITKVSEWHNGTVNGTILSIIDPAEDITYTYDLGNGETATFTLNCNGQKYDIANAEIVFGDALTYNGEEQKQIIIVYYDGIRLSSVHCKISGNRGTDAGNYTLTIEGLVDFYGTKTASWTIAKATPEAAPIISEDEYFVGDALPEIGYESKISGIIEWLTELVNGLVEGENVLEWQFTPDDADNYEVVTGTAVVEAQTTTTTTTTSSTTTSTTTETTSSSTTTSTTTETTTSSTTTSTTTETTTSSTTTSTTTETTTSSTSTSTTTETTTSSTSTSTTTETTTSSTTTSTTTETTTSSTTTSTTTETTTSSTTTSTTTETTTSSTTTSTTTTETTTSSTTTSATTVTTTSTTTSTTTETTTSSTTTSTTTKTTTTSTTTSTTTETTTSSTSTSTTTETTTSSTTTSTTTETTTSSTTTSTTTETTTSSITTSTTTETTTSSNTTSTTTETTTSSTTTSTTTATTTSSTSTSTTTETTTSSTTTSTTTETTTSSTTTSTTTETTTSSTTTSTTTETTTSSTSTSTTTETTTSSTTTSTTTETTTSSTSTSTTTETTTTSTTTSTTTETTTSSTTTSTTTETTTSSTSTSTTTETTTSSKTTSTTTETTTSSTTTSTTTETTTLSTTTSTTTETTTLSTTTSTTTTPTHIASDEELCDWAVKDYTEKTGVTPENAEIEYTSDGNAVITLTDAEGNVLDIYNINPFTGVGNESNGGEVNLPQTGYSVIYNYIMLAAVAMMIFGIYAMAKSRKRDEE